MMVASNMMATAMFLAMSPFLARALQPSGRGVLAMAQVATAMAPIILGIGTKDAAGWAVARGVTGAGFARRLGKLNRWPLAMIGITGGVYGVVALTAGGRMLPLGVTCIFLSVLASQIHRSEAILGQWMAGGRARELGTFFLAPAAVQGCFFTALMVGGALTPLSATVILLISTGLGVAYRLLVRHDDAPYIERDASLVVRQGRRWWPGLLGSTILSRLDVIFLSVFATSATLGIYSVASTASLIAQPLYPALVKRVLRSATATQGREYINFHAKVVLLLLPAAALAALAGDAMMPIIFGRAFAQSSEIFAILCAAALAVLSGNMSSQALGAIGRGDAATNVTLIWLVLGAALLLSLPKTGSALGLLTASTITTVNLGLAGTLLAAFHYLKGGRMANGMVTTPKTD